MVGTELLLGQIVDTNATYLADQLAQAGVHVYFKTTVGDNWIRMASVLSTALTRADVVLVSGGLGPTEDDLTREVIAAVMGEELQDNAEAMAHLQAWFDRAGRTMTPGNRKQARLPKNGRMIPNPRGTAPGVLVAKGGRTVIAMPGVPHELRGMMTDFVLPYLREQGLAQGGIFSKTLKFFGLGESAVEERVRDLIAAQSNPTIAPYAGMGEVKLRVTARADSAAAAATLIAPVEAALRERLHEYHFGSDTDTMESVVAELLSRSGRTLAVAESCTGGLIAHRLTNVPGISRNFLAGVVAYDNRIKEEQLGVGADILAQHGAVSEPVAAAMAAGVRQRNGTDLGVGITGIAGPGGGTEAKPVGLVYVAVADDREATTQRLQLSGDRDRIKVLASQAALDTLRRRLLAG